MDNLRGTIPLHFKWTNIRPNLRREISGAQGVQVLADYGAGAVVTCKQGHRASLDSITKQHFADQPNASERVLTVPSGFLGSETRQQASRLADPPRPAFVIAQVARIKKKTRNNNASLPCHQQCRAVQVLADCSAVRSPLLSADKGIQRL